MREDIPAAKITAPVRELTLASISDFQPTALRKLQESCRSEACAATNISLGSDIFALPLADSYPRGLTDSVDFSVSVRRLVEFFPGPEKMELIESLKEIA